MTPERLRQIEELYHAVREAAPSERAALLARTDTELLHEVESLFIERTGGGFLERPAIENAPELLRDATETSIDVGSCLGPYRIESKIGEGGMGQVFRAVDTRLGRVIAVKTTREQFSARFEREARAISSLNHPNICTLHDIGPNYLVMELVEGETLAERLKNGPLPVQTGLLYVSQIVAALAEAHAKGIVHRDLKPANIMIGRSGIKVLDFGLARMDHQDETVTTGQMIVGTPAYMAPEQREGKPAGALSDIYSFGCVLYEMFTGARVGSPQHRRITPRRLEGIINRCLEREPGRRWQSAAELQRELAAVTPARHGVRVAIAGTSILALLAIAYFYFLRSPKLGAKDRIVLAEFENKTGDPVFDQTLRQGLAVQLEQSPFLSLVSDASIQQSLRFMKRPAGSPLTFEVAREICERTGSAAVLEGSIAGVGSQYVLWLRARKCASGDAIAQEQAVAGKKEEVLSALSRIATQIRNRLGESAATIQEHSTPLDQATTSSLEALKAYSAGRSAIFARGARASMPHLQEAIAIDPQFAMAHAQLGFMLWNMGQTDLGAREVRIAYELRDSVSDREKRYITMLYDREVTGNLQKEMQTLDAWLQIYPRDTDAMAIVGGWAAQGTGQYERGIQAGQDLFRVDPNMSFGYTVAIHYLSLDRFAEVESVLRQAAERKIELPEMLVTRYYLAFLKEDLAGMQREIARAPGELAEDWISHHQALVLAHSGRMQQARIMWEHAIALAQQAGRREDTAIYLAAEAVCDAHFGYAAEAQTRARSALDLAKSRDVEYAAAFALGWTGDAAGSEAAAKDLAERFPEDTPVQFEYLPTLRALLAFRNRAPLEAIDRLQVARPYDLAMPGTSFFAKFGGLYTAYVRGEAYLVAGRGQEAAAEFQKVVDHRGIVLADPIGVLAHLQLGRAYTVQGDMAKAKNAYQRFLTLWKAADADLPVLKRARAEYAKL
jgi:eukaryotic-like serine/threonine-protein kinase